MKMKKDKTKMKINAKNYICINGKKTELTKEQLKQLGIIAETCYLSEDGKIAHIGEYEFIVIKNNEKLGTTELLLKDKLGEDVEFGSNNDFRTSFTKHIAIFINLVEMSCAIINTSF
mgnify:CR=1 FL=1